MEDSQEVKKDFKDARSFKRLPFVFQVMGKVISRSGAKHHFRGITEDVCFHGLCLKLRNAGYCRPGQEMRLKIRLHRGDFFLRARGEVCWVCNAMGRCSHTNIGVKLVRIRRFATWCERINQRFCCEMMENGELTTECREISKES